MTVYAFNKDRYIKHYWYNGRCFNEKYFKMLYKLPDDITIVFKED
jgi:hypothetical protein